MKTITALGDSIMRGVVLNKIGTQNTQRYALLEDSFSSRCGAALNLDIHNYGRFGNTTHHALRDLQRHKEQIASSDFVVMEFGGNDCDHRWEEIARDPDREHHPITSPAHYAAQYHEVIGGIRQLGSTPVLLSLPPIISDRYFGTFTRNMEEQERHNIIEWLGGCVEIITHWHEMYNLRLFQLAAQLAVPIIDITTPFLSCRNYRNLICEDGIHPNKEGHRLIAETICSFAYDYI